jgi:1L-myo-inositol 1-phosphate cytidylyltransferase / CDP-L-myo-inositol myo-inositolphosphotransferase
MNQNSHPLSHISCSVLHLLSPPEHYKTNEWYTSLIAGVPFLLRNILSLQCSGLHEIVIYLDRSQEEIEKLASTIKEDPRIKAKTHWVSNREQLKKNLQNQKGHILHFNGSALYDKKEVRFFLNIITQDETTTSATLPINKDKLDTLIEKIQQFDEKELIKYMEHIPSYKYLPGSEPTRIMVQEDFSIQHERLLAGSGQKHDSPITRLLSRPVSKIMTRFFLNTSVSPNQITLSSFAIGMGSAICFAGGTYSLNIFGGLLLLFSTWMDGTDGEIARLKFMESEFGGKLDIICDNIVHFFVFSSIGWGLAKTTGDETYLYLGGLAAFSSLASFILLGAIILKKNIGATSTAPNSEPSMADKLANRDFVNFIMLMALIDQFKVFIFIAAIGATIFTIYLIYLPLTHESK